MVLLCSLLPLCSFEFKCVRKGRFILQIPEAEAHLLRLKNHKADTEKVGDPAFLAITTSFEHV